MPRPISVSGIKLSDLTTTSSLISGDVLLIERSGTNYGIDTSVITSSITNTVSSSISGIVEDQVSDSLSSINNEIDFLSSQISSMTITVSAGIGLSGGGTISSGGTVNIRVNQTQLISGGNSQIDGDSLHIDFNPIVYTLPVNDTLSAHLSAIDGYLQIAGRNPMVNKLILVTAGSDLSAQLSNTPVNSNHVMLWPEGGPMQSNTGVGGSDFTVNGTSLTCYTSAGFLASDVVYVSYQY